MALVATIAQSGAPETHPAVSLKGTNLRRTSVLNYTIGAVVALWETK